MRIRDPRNYLIKKGLQLGLTFRFLFLVVLFTLFIGFEMYISIWPVAKGYIPENVISLVRYQMFMRFFYFLIPVIVVIAITVIIFSHRIAGPLYHIEKKLNDIIQGVDSGPIRLRKGDELKEVADLFNKLIPMIKKPELNTGEKFEDIY